MFVTLFAGALLSLGAHSDPCAKPLPHGPAVPIPLVVSTDCGWYRLERDGAVTSLGAEWLITHKQPWRPPYGLTLGKPVRSGRYVVLQQGRVVWRSTGYYRNEAGTPAFGPHAFAFDSWGKKGVFLTDLRRPERLVVHGRESYPIDFTRDGDLLVSGRRALTVVSPKGHVVGRYRYRRSSSYGFDSRTDMLYFVTPQGILSEARGSSVRRVARIRAGGAISVLGRRLLAFTEPHRITILRRQNGAEVARATWRGARLQLDAGVVVSDDGRLFAFRVSTSRPGARKSKAVVYLLHAGERHARVLYRHRGGQAGCGSGGALNFHGSLLLYRSVDGTGIAEEDLFDSGGSRTSLTALLKAMPRISHYAGYVYWTTDFRM